jgi:hypothetical protein
MTTEEKDNLLIKAAKLVNLKTVITSIATVVIVGIGTWLLTSFKSVKSEFKNDHDNMKLIVPAVRQLQKNDSVKEIKLNVQNGNIELIKAQQSIMHDDIKDLHDDLKDLKGLLVQILANTKKN